MFKFSFHVEVEAENVLAAFHKLGLSPTQVNSPEGGVTCTHISTPEQPAQIQPAPVAPIVAPVTPTASIPQSPVPIAPPSPAPVAPIVAPVTPTASIPQSPVPIAPPSPAPVVPTTAPTYTFDQIAAAGAALVDSGKQQEVIALLGQFGVQALTQLPPEHYGAFVVELRKMGAAL